MTPARRKALEWVRDNGNVLNLPDRYEPSNSMIIRMEQDDQITFHTRGHPHRTWDITTKGLADLENDK